MYLGQKGLWFSFTMFWCAYKISFCQETFQLRYTISRESGRFRKGTMLWETILPDCFFLQELNLSTLSRHDSNLSASYISDKSLLLKALAPACDFYNLLFNLESILIILSVSTGTCCELTAVGFRRFEYFLVFPGRQTEAIMFALRSIKSC